MDGSEPLRPDRVTHAGGPEEVRYDRRSWVVATGTLACPECDAPVLPDGPVSPAAPMSCPYCGEHGHVRDFLSLEAPARPAVVEVRLRATRPRA